MRLLNASTFMLKEFLGTSIPPYAILSHTWEEEEVLFSDLRSLSDAKLKKGWRKVGNTCKQAKLDGLEWVWIDTCCIDKDSSAQLSEAINSMFRFYRDSFVCYVYLSDFEDGHYRSIHHAKELRHCRWFTRGWTLQELLAPSYMVFFDASWKDVGTKQELKHLISIITGIPSRVLDDGDLRGISTAAKMSWAAGRQSTREEDQAYSLMGLFGVNIPPLYGEGGVRAFMRLQEEIIKYSDDQSIFAWNSPCLDRRSCGSLERRGLLAISPSEFRHCGNVQNPEESNRQPKLPYSLTNRGLHIHLPLKPVSIVDAPGIPPENLYIARLECHVDANAYLGIYLQRLDGREYVRWKPDLTLVLENEPQDRFENSELYVKQILPSYHRFQDEAEVELRSVTGCWKSWPESFRLVQSERLHLERQTIQNGTTCCQITDRLTQRSFDVHYGLITPDQFSVRIVPRLSPECSSSNRMMKEEGPSHNAEEFISTRLRKFFSGWSMFCICIDVLPGSQGNVQGVANDQNRQSIAIGFLTRTRIMGSAAYTLITLADVAMFVMPEEIPVSVTHAGNIIITDHQLTSEVKNLLVFISFDLFSDASTSESLKPTRVSFAIALKSQNFGTEVVKVLRTERHKGKYLRLQHDSENGENSGNSLSFMIDDKNGFTLEIGSSVSMRTLQHGFIWLDLRVWSADKC